MCLTLSRKNLHRDLNFNRSIPVHSPLAPAGSSGVVSSSSDPQHKRWQYNPLYRKPIHYTQADSKRTADDQERQQRGHICLQNRHGLQDSCYRETVSGTKKLESTTAPWALFITSSSVVLPANSGVFFCFDSFI